MALDPTTAMPPVGALPLDDVRLRRAASDIALLSAGLIVCTDSPLLAVAVPSDGWNGSAPVLLWDQRLSVCEQRCRTVCETPMFAPALDALCIAADALFERLQAWGWTDADTSGLCVVTDGVGVALVTDVPAPGPGWLIQTAHPSGHVPLLPLDEDGVWSLIAAAAHADPAD